MDQASVPLRPWEDAWEQRTHTDARRVRLWVHAPRIEALRLRVLETMQPQTMPGPEAETAGAETAGAETDVAGASGAGAENIRRARASGAEASQEWETETARAATAACVETRERVDLRVFPRASSKTRKRGTQPLARLDLTFLRRADGEAWVATFLRDTRWTRRQGLVAWCTSSPGAPEEAARGHGAHRRCCCFAQHPPGGCDACDALRLAFARRRRERRVERAERLARAYGCRPSRRPSAGSGSGSGSDAFLASPSARSGLLLGFFLFVLFFVFVQVLTAHRSLLPAPAPSAGK